ncbi:HD domain-containing protein [Psychrobacillus sp. NPDC058041]|uniref:HD domain-containing protein n=1 Tax=Psychrobacillus sp. NPDC058041 TaxID=3346310 RepID=UPI0036D8481C
MKFITDRTYARELLETANQLNPGPWYKHSLNVANAAEYIVIEMTKKGLHLDCDIAYNAGILHDIGRYKGFTKSVIHSYDGYKFMDELGYQGNAIVCVTHSFPNENKDIETAADWTIVPPYMKEKLVEVLKVNSNYDWYNKVITLCDALADENGFTTLEKRFISVGLRHGTDSNTAIRWKGFYEIKEEIEILIGKSIYELLPGIELSIYAKMEY